jgi:penicillin-binding protein 1A
MGDILRTTVTQGLSYRAALPGEYEIEVAGKTGTTSDNADIWYMGYSPYYVGGIWIGNDDSQIKVNTGSGSTSRLWGNIMKVVHDGLAPATFEEPQGVVRANVCKQSGLLATDLCRNDQRGSQITSEYFVNGTVPTEFCDVHVTANVCTESNMLAGPYCPPDLIEERVFIKREEPYDPLNYPYVKTQYYEVNGLTLGEMVIDTMLTEDYQYQVPNKVCTIHDLSYHNETTTSSGIEDGTTGQGIDEGTTGQGIDEGTTDQGIDDGTTDQAVDGEDSNNDSSNEEETSEDDGPSRED